MAVSVTVSIVIVVPAAAVKVAELAPAGTVTVAGMVIRELVLDSATEVRADAAWFKVTLQVPEALGATTSGLQRNDVKLGGTVVAIVPPEPVVWIALPDAEVLRALVTLIVVEDVAADSVTVRTATTPFWMTFAFSPLELSPVRKHM